MPFFDIKLHPTDNLYGINSSIVASYKLALCIIF